MGFYITDLYIDAISEVVGTTFENLRASGGQLDWRDLDLALHEERAYNLS